MDISAIKWDYCTATIPLSCICFRGLGPGEREVVLGDLTRLVFFLDCATCGEFLLGTADSTGWAVFETTVSVETSSLVLGCCRDCNSPRHLVLFGYIRFWCRLLSGLTDSTCFTLRIQYPTTNTALAQDIAIYKYTYTYILFHWCILLCWIAKY